VLRDVSAGLVVFLVAVPLCLGIALASGAPLFSGLVAGIVGGMIVGVLSGSSTSVSGPAAGLSAVVVAEIERLGSFSTFTLAVVLAGLFQLGLGVIRAGALSAFFPSSVIKGLLAAIGIILIFKQIPHLFGHDTDVEGDFAFIQYDHENTFSELLAMINDLHLGPALIGVTSLAFLFLWDRTPWLKKSPIPAPLVVVLAGSATGLLLGQLDRSFWVESSHLVQVPIAADVAEFASFFQFPDLSKITWPVLYLSAVTIAIVASLETVLNLEAVDKLDPKQRVSPPNRELVAQGVGNIFSGLLGGLPITSVIIRSSININSGAETKASAILHGIFLLTCVGLVPSWLNTIPLASLAAILLHTGIKLADPALFRQMARGGPQQFLPFLTTLVAIVFTDLLIGVILGLVTAMAFILQSNLHRPLRLFREKYLSGDVLRIELADQVSFLNRASLAHTLEEARSLKHVAFDARNTVYIDPDILDLLHEFKTKTAPAHGIQVSMLGFQDRYQMKDQIAYVDYTTRELRDQLRPDHVLQLLQEGNQRFVQGKRLNRDLVRIKQATAAGQYPLAVVLSCIDSRAPVEMIFDMALGDLFSVRIAGNVARHKVLGSIEYATVVAGVKLVLVLGHTRCGAVGAAVDLARSSKTALEATGCEHLDVLINEIQRSIDPHELGAAHSEGQAFVDNVARVNVMTTLTRIRSESHRVAELEASGSITILGGLYDLETGEVDFFGALTPLQKQTGGSAVDNADGVMRSTEQRST
jgi:carbonic anhydrase/SulP family sulfate permease